MIQRVYRAACPSCGAPVDFQSAQSVLAVCGYCRSTVTRDGETLRRTGSVSELFDDFSPLQLGAGGKADGRGFTLVGRLQYRWTDGTWNEWYGLEDDGTGLWLSEDNGQYVLMRDAPSGIEAPPVARLVVGQSQQIGNGFYKIVNVLEAALIGAQGELPFTPVTDRPIRVVDARTSDGRVASIDLSDAAAPRLYLGQAVTLAQLEMTNLRDAQEKAIGSQGFACPNCGAPVQAQLAGTQRLTCGSCASLIDISKGIGAAVVEATQNAQMPMAIPLGATGTFRGADWQVVGVVQRSGVEPGDDERFFWSEYLLYSQRAGFRFLVDTTDGWNWVQSLQSAPLYGGGPGVAFGGRTYERESAYQSRVEFVSGEFYWKVRIGQAHAIVDFRDGDKVLSQERDANEETWSAGERVPEAELSKALPLNAAASYAAGAPPPPPRTPGSPLDLFRGAGMGGPPLPGGGARATTGSGCLTLFALLFLFLIIAVILDSCDEDGGGGGGSGSSWGGHK